MKLAILALVVACGSKSAPAPAPTPDTSCERDDDCVAVERGCCGCSAGGDVAIMNRAGAALVPKPECGEVNCLTVMSQTPNCMGTPACRAGRCVAVPRK